MEALDVGGKLLMMWICLGGGA